MEEKTIRVLRCIEYIGPESLIKAQLERSIHGVKKLPNGVSIAVSTVGIYPEELKETFASLEESHTNFNPIINW